MRSTICFALVLAALAPSPLSAQDYPSRPITLVVPLAAGTGLDVIARFYGERLAQSLGKPVVVENRPGAGMIPATQAALAAPPDGHTLLVATSSTLSINQTLFKQLPYDPEKDLVPVAHYIIAPFILALNPALPPRTVPEFIKYAKEQPAPLNYSSPAGGGVAHFAVELMKHRFGLNLTHVPYKNSPQSIMDIAAGHVHFAFAESGASLPLIRDGKLRALAVSSSQRLPAKNDIPTFAEASGVSGLRSRGVAHPGRQREDPASNRRAAACRNEKDHGGSGDAGAYLEHGIDSGRPAADRRDRALYQVRDREVARRTDQHRIGGDAMTLARLALFALAAVFASSPAHAQLGVEFPLKGADGTPIANHRLAPAVVTQAAKLPGTVVAGNPDGDVTLMQFYDLNCPFCRRAAQDIDELVKSDRNLKMVFVPYPILSAQSVEGGRVELALREMSAQQFLEFRQRIYKTRGTIDGARSLAVVKEMGIDPVKVIELANLPWLTDILKAHAQLASAGKLFATPSYVVADVAIVGHPGLKTLREVVSSVRKCKAAVC